MGKLIISLLALALVAVAFASPMGIGMGIGHGMVSSHHSSHIGHGHMMGYPGIGMIGHGMTMGSVHKSYHHGMGMYPGMIMG
ncbi:hypothetical protein Ocin01_14092 [Orchesella cincta]|uniref:Uncharacterized protein n=1 Tax=Orchesella cincta TaxID=48709 RepID=A0A1D2MIC8_ORCCI|nr:hypothetical protein Ocin01_14092 [Orchesella cincta]